MTPIERPRARREGGEGRLVLEFEDLGLAHGVADASNRRYRWELWRGSRRIGRGEEAARPGIRQRIEVAGPAADEGELLELRIRAVPGPARAARVWLREGEGEVRPAGLLH